MAVRWLPLAGVAMACALIVACGGDDKKSDSTATASSGGSTAAAGTTATAGTTAEATSDGEGSGGEPDAEIRAIAAKFSESTFSATYKATGSDPDALTGGTLALIKDGTTRFRFDVTTQQDGQDVAVVFIQTEDKSAFCLKDAAELGALLGIEAGQGVCLKTSEDDASNPVGNIKELFSDIENVNVTVLEKTSREIAGQDGTCYRTRDNESDDLSTVCFSDDGVLLYVKSEGDAPSEIEAQTVSDDVDDDDFTLPYEERELPGGLGGP